MAVRHRLMYGSGIEDRRQIAVTKPACLLLAYRSHSRQLLQLTAEIRACGSRARQVERRLFVSAVTYWVVWTGVRSPSTKTVTMRWL
jgi:hypothetical protein